MIEPLPPRIFFDSTVVDLRLAARLDQWTFLTPDALGTKFRPAHPDFNYTAIEKAHTKGHDLATAGPFDLAPKGFVLSYTLERIYLPHTSRICARVEGKSTLARLGLGVHVTAPTIHAGFGFNRLDPAKSGTPLRLEMWNCGPLPIELQNGMRICQLILEEVREVPTAGYGGAHNEQGA